MGYKVGDKVRVRADLVVGDRYGADTLVRSMSNQLGEIVEIRYVTKGGKYIIKEDTQWTWTDEMFEGLADHPQGEWYMKDKLIKKLEEDKIKYSQDWVAGYKEGLDQAIKLIQQEN